MFGQNHVMSSFSVDDVSAAKDFYGGTLGFETKEGYGGLLLTFADGGRVMVYPKPDHQPATYTALSVLVDDLESTVDELTAKGVAFEQYGEPFNTDAKGISRDEMGSMAWLKDPAGNVIGLMQVPDEMRAAAFG